MGMQFYELKGEAEAWTLAGQDQKNHTLRDEHVLPRRAVCSLSNVAEKIKMGKFNGIFLFRGKYVQCNIEVAIICSIKK